MNRLIPRIIFLFCVFAALSISSYAAVGFLTQKNKTGDWESSSSWSTKGSSHPDDLHEHNVHIARGGNITITEGKVYSVNMLTIASHGYEGNGALMLMPNSSLQLKSGIILGNRSKATGSLTIGKGASIVANSSAGIRMALGADTTAILNIDGASVTLKSPKANFVIAGPTNGETQASVNINNSTITTGNRTIMAIAVSTSATQKPKALVKITGTSTLNTNIAIGGNGGGSGILELSSSATLAPNASRNDKGLEINATGKLVIKQKGDSFNTINLSRCGASFAPGSELILDGSNYKGGSTMLTLFTVGSNASGQQNLALKAENFPNHNVSLSWGENGKSLTATISKK